MKIEKIIKTFAIVAFTIGSVFTFSQTTEAATISIEKAAQKIYKAETKAYNTKKDTSVTVKVAAPASSKKAIKKVFGKLEDVLVKEELGDVDLTYVVRNTYVRPAIGELTKRLGKDNCSPRGISNPGRDRFFYYPAHDAAVQTASYKNGVLTIKFDIKGSKKWYRDQYYENTCLAKCVAQLRERTEGMSEKDKAWTVAQWVDERFVYSGKYGDASRTAYHFFLEGLPVASGECEQHANAYQLFGCLMGLNAGFLEDGHNHAFGCVKIDGEVYVYDGTESNTGDWERIVRNEGNEYSLRVSNIAGVKEWVDGISVGEWCLLTPEEFAQVVSCSDPDDWRIYWKIGGKWDGSSKYEMVKDLI